MSYNAIPAKQGLYDPRNEHDACGVGFIAHIKGRKSHDIICQGLEILKNITHRGAVGADPWPGMGLAFWYRSPMRSYGRNAKGTGLSCRPLAITGSA